MMMMDGWPLDQAEPESSNIRGRKRTRSRSPSSSPAAHDAGGGGLKEEKDIYLGVRLSTSKFGFKWVITREGAGHAPNGSIIYALGGCNDHFDPNAAHGIYNEISSRLSPLPPTHSNTNFSEQLDLVCKPDNLCSHVYFCDFSDYSSSSRPRWKISSPPLVSPRLLPKLVSLQHKLFAFGGNCPSDEEAAPFAEFFDPIRGYWDSLPPSPFPRPLSSELYVFPLATTSRILVVRTGSDIQYTFDVLTWEWCPLNNQESLTTIIQPPEYYFFRDIYHWSLTSPVLSIFDEAMYWIQRGGRLYVYNIAGDGKFHEGSITGLLLEEHVLFDISCFHFALIPLSKHLMGLLWVFNDDDDGPVLHLTIFRISFLPHKVLIEDDNDYGSVEISLTAPVVACLAFPLQGGWSSVVDAYLMGEGEGNIFEAGKVCCPPLDGMES